MSKNHLNFQDVVTLRFQKNYRFACGEPNGTFIINRTQAKQWEKFLLLNPNDLSSSSPIQYGQEVLILSYHNKYLTCNQNGTVVASENIIKESGKWRFFHHRSNIRTGTVNIHENVLLKSYRDDILLVGAYVQSSMQLNNNRRDEASINIQLQDIWSFYYDKPIPYYDEDGNNLCKSRGRFDGANCFIGKPPIGDPFGKPFIFKNNFYYKCRTPNDVVMGHWDGVNAKVGSNDVNDVPFIFNDQFYLKPSTPTIHYINGIFTDAEKGRENVKVIEKYFSNKSVNLIHNTSDGVLDLGETARDYAWLSSTRLEGNYSWLGSTQLALPETYPPNNVMPKIIELLESGKQKDLPLHILASSQGSMIIYNAIWYYCHRSEENRNYLKRKVKLCCLGVVFPDYFLNFLRLSVKKFKSCVNRKDPLADVLGLRDPASLHLVVAGVNMKYHYIKWYLPLEEKQFKYYKKKGFNNEKEPFVEKDFFTK